MTQAVTVAEYTRRIGEEVGLSSWLLVDQSRINQFADVTDDPQFIHIDPERARVETPFGGTIAHGFLSLSMLSAFAYEALPRIEGRKMGINFGFEKVRFVSPVRSGSRIRARFILKGVTERRPGQVQLTYGVTVEIEGSDKPALTADWLSIAILGEVD